MKWYKKATVQTALVHASINLITGIIAIVAIIFTSKHNQLQINTQKEIFNKQYNQDSIKNKLEIELLKKQISLTKNQFLLDSMLKERTLLISKTQLSLLQEERNIYIEQQKQELLENIANYNLYMLDFNYENINNFTLNQFDNFLEIAISKIKLIMQNPYLIRNSKNLKGWSEIYKNVLFLYQLAHLKDITIERPDKTKFTYESNKEDYMKYLRTIANEYFSFSSDIMEKLKY